MRSTGRRLGMAAGALAIMLGALITSPPPASATKTVPPAACGNPCDHDDECNWETCHCAFQALICIPIN